MLGLLLVTLLTGLLVPVYTDEVAWRFQLSRYLQDGLDHTTGETCGANIWAAPATFMLPVRIFSSVVTSWMLGPLAVRMAGVFFAILGVIGVLAIVRQAHVASERRSMLELYILSLFGLGVLPFLLVWSRPDQPLWLALLGSLLLGFARTGKPGDREPLIRIAGIAILTLIAFSYHLKSLFYLPVFILAVVASGRHAVRFRVRAVTLAIIAAAAASAYHYWSSRFACPGDALLAAKLSKESVIPLLTGGNWRDALGAIPKMFYNILPNLYLGLTLPAPGYMSDWLPPAPISTIWLHVWRIIAIAGWAIGVLVGIAHLTIAVRDRARRRWPLIAAATLFGCASGWAALQINKNAYEASVYLPVVALALGAMWMAPAGYRAWLAKPVWAIAILSVASQTMLIGSYAAPLWAAGRAGGYIAGQPFSLSAFAYPRAQILAAGDKCGIGHGASMRRVLIDDLTYFAYADTTLPMHRLGVLSTWNGSAGDVMTWMRTHGSPGAVLACEYLDPALRARAIATGPICCLATR